MSTPTLSTSGTTARPAPTAGAGEDARVGEFASSPTDTAALVTLPTSASEEEA
ncbi:MAG TPA: hypothetical protein VER39_09125 [Nocardioidaceae bacterium]|nr:hypothetical protein [Nocardioidaceae bacterium]